MSTFALPDLRGRVPIGTGAGPGLTPRSTGEVNGAEVHTLGVAELPAHGHAFRAATLNGTADDPAAGVLARNPAAIPTFGPTADVNLAPGAISSSGGSQPHNNMQPYLTLSYIIALQGTTP